MRNTQWGKRERKTGRLTHSSRTRRPRGKQCSLTSMMSLLLRSRVSRWVRFRRRLPWTLLILLWCLWERWEPLLIYSTRFIVRINTLVKDMSYKTWKTGTARDSRGNLGPAEKWCVFQYLSDFGFIKRFEFLCWGNCECKKKKSVNIHDSAPYSQQFTEQDTNLVLNAYWSSFTGSGSVSTTGIQKCLTTRNHFRDRFRDQEPFGVVRNVANTVDWTKLHGMTCPVILRLTEPSKHASSA